MKRTLVALACLALAPTALAATRVGSPITGTVTATTYYSTGSFRTLGIVCNGSGSGTQNEALHTWADGWMFRQWHFLVLGVRRQRPARLHGRHPRLHLSFTRSP